MAQPLPCPAAPALRRSALASARGVALAVHAAAGLCREVDRESERLLRCCEGILRAAVARLDALGRLPGPSPSPVVPALGGGDEVILRKVKKRVRRKKVKPTAAAAGPAVDGLPVSMLVELDDAWADGCSPLAMVQSDRAPRVLVRGVSDEASLPPSKLARGSATSTSSSTCTSFPPGRADGAASAEESLAEAGTVVRRLLVAEGRSVGVVADFDSLVTELRQFSG